MNIKEKYKKFVEKQKLATQVSAEKKARSAEESLRYKKILSERKQRQYAAERKVLDLEAAERKKAGKVKKLKESRRESMFTGFGETGSSKGRSGSEFDSLFKPQTKKKKRTKSDNPFGFSGNF